MSNTSNKLTAATVTHNGETIASLSAGQTATLRCAGMKMIGDVVVAVDSSIGSGSAGDEAWIDDGNTHIWISLPEGRTSPMLGVCPKGTITVDWGDGTTSTLTGTSTSTVKWTSTHNYASAGDYVITLSGSGTMSITADSYGTALLRCTSTNDNRNKVYQNAIQRVEVGSNVTSLGMYAFYNCYSVKRIKIQEGMTSIGQGAFYNCYALSSLAIPNSVTTIDKNAIYTCYTLFGIVFPDSVSTIGNNVLCNSYVLKNVVIPSSLTAINSDFCSNCYSLASVTIPKSVTSIAQYAFQKCYSLKKVRFESDTPPAITSTYAFKDIPTDCIISVPVGSLSAYTSATNYPSSATYTYVEE